MALTDVSNDPAHARGAKAAGFSIPGLTKPALVAEKPAAKASKASKATKAADGTAKATRKRAPGAKKAAALTTTPPPAASRAKMTAKENVSFAEAPADPKTPYEPKTPRAPAVGFAEAAAAADVTQQFKTPGNVTFAAHDVEEDEEDHADDQGDDAGGANGEKRGRSRRQHARPERFGEFKSWNSVQKGTLGTPGHGLLSKQARLRLGGRDESVAEGSGTSTSSAGSSGGGSRIFELFRQVRGGGQGEDGGAGGGCGDAHDGAVQRGGVRRGGARGARARRGADAHGGRGAPRGGPRGGGGGGEREEPARAAERLLERAGLLREAHDADGDAQEAGGEEGGG
jgi:hypothetical protein